MKNFFKLLSLTLILMTGWANAHVNHDQKPQTINKARAIEVATYQVQKLVINGQLDKSWQGAEVTDTVFGAESRSDWVVSFNNPYEVDENKKILSVFLTNSGYFVSKSFTGE